MEFEEVQTIRRFSSALSPMFSAKDVWIIPSLYFWMDMMYWNVMSKFFFWFGRDRNAYFVYRACNYVPVGFHFSCLADSVYSIKCLFFAHRVPLRFHDMYPASGCEIETVCIVSEMTQRTCNILTQFPHFLWKPRAQCSFRRG